MIDLSLAFRANGGLFLCAVFLTFFIIAQLQLHVFKLHASSRSNISAQISGCRAASYVSGVLFLISLLAWVGLLLAVRFDWHRDDVSEIEILTFPSTDSAAQREQRLSVENHGELSRLFDVLALLQPYNSGGHEHAVGKYYILRLRRRSDGQWSSYRLKIYPNMEPTGGGVQMTGVYEVSLVFSSHKYNLGSYQAPELGRVVEQLTQRGKLK